MRAHESSFTIGPLNEKSGRIFKQNSTRNPYFDTSISHIKFVSSQKWNFNLGGGGEIRMLLKTYSNLRKSRPKILYFDIFKPSYGVRQSGQYPIFFGAASLPHAFLTFFQFPWPLPPLMIPFRRFCQKLTRIPVIFTITFGGFPYCLSMRKKNRKIEKYRFR